MSTTLASVRRLKRTIGWSFDVKLYPRWSCFGEHYSSLEHVKEVAASLGVPRDMLRVRDPYGVRVRALGKYPIESTKPAKSRKSRAA